MSVSSGFFNSFNHDRTYNAEQISSMFDGVFSDGVFATFGNAFAVNAASGYSVTVGSGRAWFNHRWIYNDAPIQVEFNAPDLLRPRYDALVIEIDSREDGRICSIKVIDGEPNTVPQKPNMVKSETVNQYPLAYIYREANSSAITVENIDIRIGTSECPYITGLIDTVDADNFLARWQSQFDGWSGEIRDMIADLAAAIEQAKQLEIVDGAVTTPKLANDSVTYLKLADDVKAKFTNPNLLDNPWFTVNQRGATSYTANDYGLDRWRSYNITDGVISGSMVTFSTGTLYQILDEARLGDLIGETVTGSVMLADGSIHSGTIVVTNTIQSFVKYDGIEIAYSGGNKHFEITANGHTIKAVKLEYGSVSTLVNDRAPDYQDELAKCRRYYVKISGGSTSRLPGYAGNTGSDVAIWTPYHMRTIPSCSGSISYRIGGSARNATMLGCVFTNGDQVVIQASCPNAPANTVGAAIMSGLTLSADL